MAHRKTPLVNDGVYHIFTRSISDFNIFRSDRDYKRIKDTIAYYSLAKPECKFSLFEKLTDNLKQDTLFRSEGKGKLADIIAYCIMPTHVHLILKQLKDNGISVFMNRILKSYGRYFNIKYNRLGPLCEGRFKNVLVDTNEYFLHLTRYIHLNPVSSSLAAKPEDWQHSSYAEYLSTEALAGRICNFDNLFQMSPEKYKQFVDERTNYQIELQKIKHLLID
jgi:putative transposase